MNAARIQYGALLALFALSGFAGLIYESIWSHYLKLVLGHAAYAQSLVLMIYMGGMALGAWIAARGCRRWHNPLFAYAAVEALLGVLGLGFHDAFTAGAQFTFGAVLPALSSGTAAKIIVWTFGALLIAPQSVLLGMTFPLISGALVRRFPDRSGRILALLYFTNSLGGAVGVLVGGFVLIAAVGLPGTLFTAALLNVALALTVWALSRTPGWRLPPPATSEGPSRLPRLMLSVAFLTGAASFIYEIVWIRMLSLVLGSATHSFELMLSAFILGLSLGAWWIRRRIDTLPDALGTLARIQVAMGLLAAATLVGYSGTFELMAWAMRALARTQAGYLGFHLASHAIALLVMLPATICAGMTLPLITHRLMSSGHGERSIGHVYAANTLGAIVGVVLTVHLLMPHAGLAGALMIGAVIDVTLGVAIFAFARGTRASAPRRAALIGAACLLGASFAANLDPALMASGVYRYGRTEVLAGAKVTFHRDGATATVHVIEHRSGVATIATNGKPDAALAIGDSPVVTEDQQAMTLIAALSLGTQPDARSAAVVGFGAGMTSHVLLGSRRLERVDTIEIEPAILAGAAVYRQRTARAFDDPRSRVVIDDARSWLATHPGRYDLIVSEPSNPWVSGVSSLFTVEFYRFVRERLRSGGVFGQWLQGYEMSLPLAATVVNALGAAFVDYAIYAINDRDLLIVAANQPLRPRFPALFEEPRLARALEQISIRGPTDLAALRIGSKRLLAPYFSELQQGMNSDYYPLLDLGAARARFLGQAATELTLLRTAPLPVVEMLEVGQRAVPGSLPPDKPLTSLERRRSLAAALIDRLNSTPVPVRGSPLPADVEQLARLLQLEWARCDDHGDDAAWIESLVRLAVMTFAFLPPPSLQGIWKRLPSPACRKGWSDVRRHWVALVQSVSRRDARAMATHADWLLAAGRRADTPRLLGYLVTASMLGHLAGGDRRRAARTWAQQYQALLGGRSPPAYLGIMAALATSR